MRMTEIIIVAKKSRLVIPRFFFAPNTAILLITNVGIDDAGDRIFISDTRGEIKSLKNIVNWRPVVVNVGSLLV